MLNLALIEGKMSGRVLIKETMRKCDKVIGKKRSDARYILKKRTKVIPERIYAVVREKVV